MPGQWYALVERLTHTSVGLGGACAGVVPGAVARARLAAALTTVGAGVGGAAGASDTPSPRHQAGPSRTARIAGERGLVGDSSGEAADGRQTERQFAAATGLT